MKTCTVCSKQQPIENFNKQGKTGRAKICKTCKKDYDAERYERKRDKLLGHVRQTRKAITEYNVKKQYEYQLGHPCVDCGETDPVVLEFDHVSQEGKVDTLSDLLYKYFLLWEDDRVQTELQKCVVLCANCHKRRTAKQLNWAKYRFQKEPW